MNSMGEFDKLENLAKSKGYKDAEKRITSWKRRLEKADPEEAMRIMDERNSFFTQMRETEAELYSVFEIDDKVLGELIYKKLTGEEIVID